MTDDTEIDRAFAAHDAFESGAEGYVATSTSFEARADAAQTDDAWRFEVTVRVPTLPAAVEGEVGDAVASGWFETLELRLEDAYDVIRVATTTDPVVERDAASGEVTVEFSFVTGNPRHGVDEAAALVDFVEGTYVQGVIPGYDYEQPVADLVDRARQRGQRAADSGSGPDQ